MIENIHKLSTAIRGMGSKSLTLGVAIGLFLSFGCADGEIRLNDPFDRQFSLEEAQHRYSTLVRWSQFKRAKTYVAKEERDAYLERMEVLEDARFTDFEADAPELDEEKASAKYEVVYTLYLPTNPFEIELTEIQYWTRDGVTNAWTVDSNFDALPSIASK